ncbi:hypothetical protein [Hymenobacter latericus]|uniref:hypothetical protein n=1 Tax=Hymenobacter sp. YIM 151858-1 TaxID=2987688 RepID=UPI002225E932|nr:hypothetical protein [Hymenobacter sp. YIM 151858-1]UYZ60214.1 hypothetical protein OIS50_05290 [Hymenobacter sp. YIM 151858-1]
MEQPAKEPTLFQQILRSLPRKNGVVEETIRRLAQKGISITTSGIYQLLNGRSSRPEVIEVFLEVAEEAKDRQRQIQERAQKLIADA